MTVQNIEFVIHNRNKVNKQETTHDSLSHRQNESNERKFHLIDNTTTNFMQIPRNKVFWFNLNANYSINSAEPMVQV